MGMNDEAIRYIKDLRDENHAIYEKILESASRVSSTLTFLGTYDPTIKYRTGDVCVLGGATVVFDGKSWQTIGTVSDLSNRHDEKPKRIVYGNCKCCGAPLKSQRCEYCGVVNKIEEVVEDATN